MRELRMRLALIGSGLRFRAKSSIALLALAAFSIGAGAFGPIYLHSADQSLLATTLDSAPVGAPGLSLEPAGNGASAAGLTAAAALARRPGVLGWFGAPIYTALAGITGTKGGAVYLGTLEARTGACAHLDLVSGTCPTRRGEVLLSVRSAALLGVRVGRTWRTTFAHVHGTSSFTVSGLYRPDNPDAPFWWGNDPFGFGPSGQHEDLDAAFTLPSTLRPAVAAGLVSDLAQLPYVRGSLEVDDAARLEAALSSFDHRALSEDGVAVHTDIPVLLADAAADEHTTTTIVAVVDLQFLLLSLIALYFIAASTTTEREGDVRVAALRGYRRRSTAAVALAEPAAIVIIGVPIGLLLAWLLAVLTAGSFFGPGIGASLTPLAIGAAVVTGAIGLASTALGSRRMLALSGIEEVESASPRNLSARWRLIADVAVVSVAAAAFIELAIVGVASGASGRSDDPLAAGAPALLAVAIGVLVSRMLPFILRPVIRRTRHSAKVAWFLASRRIARRRGFSTKVLLVGVAASLIVFATSGWSVFGRNLDRQTAFAVGAGSVATVDVTPGVNLLDAVRRADPSGHSAMAAVVENASDGTTLAVDASRMADVMSWPSGLSGESVASLARQLQPRGLAPAVELRGSAVRIEITADYSFLPAPVLQLDLFGVGYGTPLQVSLGPLQRGKRTYTATLGGQCSAGCRLVDLSVTWSPTSDVQTTAPARLALDSVSELRAGGWTAVAAGLDSARDWNAPQGGASFSTGSGGLSASLTLDADGGPVLIAPRDVPTSLPVIATPGSEIGASPGTPLAVIGLDGATINGRAVTEVQALPRVGDSAVLADLSTAESMMTEPFQFITTEVWLSADASPVILQRLRAAGVTPVAVESAAVDEAQKSRGGNALAYRLFVLAAIGAVLVAVGAGAVGLLSEAGRRRGELASLRAFGLGARSIRRSLAAEELLVAGSGILVGTVSGLLASLVALKSVPEFPGLGAGPPLVFGLPALLLVGSIAVLAAAFVLTVALGSFAAVQAASPHRVGDAS